MKQLFWTGALLVVALVAMWRVTAVRAERAEAEIAALRRVTEILSARAPQAGGPAPREIVVAQPTPAAEPPSSERAKGRPSAQAAPRTSSETTYADMRAYFQTSLEAQGVDVNWSRDAGRNLRAMFDQMAIPATKVASVDCRQTICRTELTHGSDGDARAFMQKWMYGGGRTQWKGPVTGGVEETEADGTVRSVFYLAREGTELPRLD
jgi:hypothetical protein